MQLLGLTLKIIYCRHNLTEVIILQHLHFNPNKETLFSLHVSFLRTFFFVLQQILKN
jgi:hypothetical protein